MSCDLVNPLDMGTWRWISLPIEACDLFGVWREWRLGASKFSWCSQVQKEKKKRWNIYAFVYACAFAHARARTYMYVCVCVCVCEKLCSRAIYPVFILSLSFFIIQINLVASKINIVDHIYIYIYTE